MLKNTFLHISGLGIRSEQRIWSSGVLSWEDLLRGKPYPLFSAKTGHFTARYRGIPGANIREQSQLLRRPPTFQPILEDFSGLQRVTAYLDIETTGLDFCFNEITTIALYDGKSVFTYVQGQNLDQFREDIEKYKVIVTYNGKCFDIPFLGALLE